MHFRYTDRYGYFAVPMKMVFVNDNDNRCISGVFGWDFGLVLSKVFVACVPDRVICFHHTCPLLER